MGYIQIMHVSTLGDRASMSFAAMWAARSNMTKRTQGKAIAGLILYNSMVPKLKGMRFKA